MDNVKKFIAKAHKSADKAIIKAQKRNYSFDIGSIEDWLNKPLVIKTGHFAAVYLALFAILFCQVMMG